MSGSFEERMNVRIVRAGTVRMIWHKALFKRKMDGKIVDVSVGGIQVSAASPLPEGKKVKLDIRMVSGPQASPRYRLCGRVARCVCAPNAGRCLIGVVLTSNRGDRGAWNDAIFAHLRTRNEY